MRVVLIASFADREFYQDWWNSTSWDQFSRKWNKPVHVSEMSFEQIARVVTIVWDHSRTWLTPQTFLLRHVYASTMDSLQLSRMSAAFVTFLLSALCHELVMAVVSKKIRPYLFLMQVSRGLGK
jgi:sterol O-acyltransferase